MTLFQKSILALGGVTALGIGAAILIVPARFYATYGISIGSDPSLLSEIRAPGGALLTMGFFMLAGLVRPGLAQVSRWITAGVFLSYGLSRLLSFILDGAPDGGLMLAALFEITIGTLCLVPPGTRRHKGQGRRRFVIAHNRHPT